MCPACIAIAVLVAGVASTGSLAAFVAKGRNVERLLEGSPDQIREENEQ